MPRIVRQPLQALIGRAGDSRGRSSIRAPPRAGDKWWADPATSELVRWLGSTQVPKPMRKGRIT